MKDQTPFEQLSEADQKAAIDIGVCVAVLGTRVPSCGKPLFDYVATEFVSSYNLPPNIAKYALRQIGRSLYTSNWTFTVEKRGNELVTRFERPGNEDGHNPLQEAKIIH